MCAAGLQPTASSVVARAGCISVVPVSSQVERHRFLRAVCSCHSASEEEILLPAARRLCPDQESARLSLKVGPADVSPRADAVPLAEQSQIGSTRQGASAVASLHLAVPMLQTFPLLQACEEEHTSEAAHFEELGRLLKEVKAFARYAGSAHPGHCEVRHPGRSPLHLFS